MNRITFGTSPSNQVALTSNSYVAEFGGVLPFSGPDSARAVVLPSANLVQSKSGKKYVMFYSSKARIVINGDIRLGPMLIRGKSKFEPPIPEHSWDSRPSSLAVATNCGEMIIRGEHSGGTNKLAPGRLADEFAGQRSPDAKRYAQIEAERPRSRSSRTMAHRLFLSADENGNYLTFARCLEKRLSCGVHSQFKEEDFQKAAEETSKSLDKALWDRKRRRASWGRLKLPVSIPRIYSRPNRPASVHQSGGQQQRRTLHAPASLLLVM